MVLPVQCGRSKMPPTGDEPSSPAAWEAVKVKRTAAKRAVTVAARRLKNGADLGMESVPELVSSLESSFLEFLDLCDEFDTSCDEHSVSVTDREVSGLAPDKYRASQSDLFKSTMEEYRRSMTPVEPSTPRQKVLNLKKREIPSFTGERRDWPEFKRMWQALVVPEIDNTTVLAAELKKACSRGKAILEIDTISAGGINAYESMWSALCATYDNVVLAVSSALDEVKSFHPVSDDDYIGIVSLIRKVKSIYGQLLVLDQVDLVTNREVVDMLFFFPSTLKREWAEVHFTLTAKEQLRPFRRFHDFMSSKLEMTKYLADTTPKAKVEKKQDKSSFFSAGGELKRSPCSIHLNPHCQHKTEECQVFQRKPAEERRQIITLSKSCVKCLSPGHDAKTCNTQILCNICGRPTHHSLICYKTGTAQVPPGTAHVSTGPANFTGTGRPSHAKAPGNNSKFQSRYNPSNYSVNRSEGASLYAIYSTKVSGSKNNATVFCDSGSEISFISADAVHKFRPRKVGSTPIKLTTLASSIDIISNIYELKIFSKNGMAHNVILHELKNITGPVHQLNPSLISKLFPNFNTSILQRPTGVVDILLGADHFYLHPKHELASDGENLSIMDGELGICIQGNHPALVEHTTRDLTATAESRTFASHFAVSTFSNFTPPYSHMHNAFPFGEELGTTVNPLCGSCKCGKCPIAGHTYSFKEEQELKIIQSNLEYHEDGHWVTSYPWIVNPDLLPNNYYAALATLKSTEKKLISDGQWGSTYSDQIQDMADRGVARRLSQEEMDKWEGPVFYLSHLAVQNPKSLSTPVRIVFNSSQTYRGVSLNNFLAKGPDSYRTSLISILLRFRENEVVYIGDIKKMYNSVHLQMLEQHTHRFLWRELEDREPDIWCITRVNMGDKPAGAIAVEAKDKTAEMFKDEYPAAAEAIIHSSYVDDIIGSVKSLAEAKDLTEGIDSILNKGGFKIKEWSFGGVGVPSNLNPISVLGINWSPGEDVITFKVSLNFSPKKRGIRTLPDISLSQVASLIPLTLTRRIVLAQVMGIYDPLGFLSPFLIKAKVYLRQSWVENLQWDEPFSDSLYNLWKQFFIDLADIENLSFPRCLKPQNSIGDPQLIILSDGSELAYGCAAYIRWELPDGSFWVRLIMGKCRIAPINRISIPQMELNGAVLSKRIRVLLEREFRFSFSCIYQLVDSETVLNMLHRLSTRFKVYEGIRIGEIQSATGGDLSCWGWIPGKLNIADWVTRFHSPHDLGPKSEWFCGPKFLRSPIEEWEVRFGPSLNGPLPGEKVCMISSNFVRNQPSFTGSSINRCSRVSTVIGALARVIAAVKGKSFTGIRKVSVPLLAEAEALLIKDAQKDFKDVRKQFKTLMPVQQDDIWVIGTRIAHTSPLTPDNKPQVLLPPKNPLTIMLMNEAHSKGHPGRDGTLAKFRGKYWTSNANKIASKVISTCQLCKLSRAHTMTQVMGNMPPARLLPAPPFTSIMVDLFGPYAVRGEVQKRTTGKAWGVIFTDLCCRAVHIEVSLGYDSQSFLLAFRRFAAVRGWPQIIFSDPGTQLQGAKAELDRAFKGHGCEWHFSPADSPWRQGAVEALIKSTKKALFLSIKNDRLSPSELLTIFTEVANVLNERPIGVRPSPDSFINILTPNNLLLGRSSADNPGCYDSSVSLFSRINVVEKIVDVFWKHWVILYAPTLVRQTKWKSVQDDLKAGDIVLVLDQNALRGEYKIARVENVLPSHDGHIRSATLSYKRFKAGEKPHIYNGGSDVQITRSVQRLVRLVEV